MMETRAGLRGNSSCKLACWEWTPIRRLDAAFSGATKLTLTILGSLCAVVGMLAFVVTPAQGDVTHDFLPE
jgi:hypothetical protein